MNAAPPAFPTHATISACRRFGYAWLALAAALALHVTDEALTGFLSVYNPAVRSIRSHFPWIPLPTFGFGVWIAGLALLILILVALTPFAFRGARWLAIVGLPFSGLMIANGLGHMAGSVFLARAMPGLYSSPILIAAAVAALMTAVGLIRRPRVE